MATYLELHTTEELETVIEDDAQNDNEEAHEQVEEPKPDETPKEAPQEKTREEREVSCSTREPPQEDGEFENKTDRMTDIQVI